MRDFFSPGRSPVCGPGYAVASSHPLASAAGLQVLAEGGNAVDAAVVATAVLCVVEPQSTGFGGDCFALISRNGAVPPIGYNGSGRSPKALGRDDLGGGGLNRIPETSVHSVTVPGLLEGIARLLKDHGTFSLARALGPAIAYAEGGFPVHQKVAFEWATVARKLAATAEASALYLPLGRVPQPGEVIRSPALAATLRRIADGGIEAFYAGETASAMVRYLRGKGGRHALEDFSAHKGEYVEPVSLDYRGCTLWEIPPNGQGVTALLMLAILDALDFGDEAPGSLRYHHLLAEATRLAFAERNRSIGDPQHGEIAVDRFLDTSYAARLARSIDTAERPHAEKRAEALALGDTAYVAVVDKERNAVSLISSLFENFGCGLVDPVSGIVFHCRGSGFVLDADHPNSLAPGKRPLHTIIPGMMSRGGRVTATFGVTGGAFQPIGHAKLVSAMLDRGLDIQAAIDEPRTFLRDGTLQFEPALAGIAEGLRAAGHLMQPADQAVGGAHGITIDWQSGVLTGGSDARKDGCAMAV